jgi:hypothetical protein
MSTLTADYANIPVQLEYNPTGSEAEHYYTYIIDGSSSISLALPGTNFNGQYISFNNCAISSNTGTFTITAANPIIYDATSGSFGSSLVLSAGQRVKLVYSSSVAKWFPMA